MALCASVIIDDIVNKIDKLYDYAVPGSIEKNLKAGMRVVVPFSKSNIKKKALVVELHDFVDIPRLKYIDKIIDKEVIVNDMQVSLIRLLKSRYFVTYYNALRAMIPRGLDFKISEYYKCNS